MGRSRLHMTTNTRAKTSQGGKRTRDMAKDATKTLAELEFETLEEPEAVPQRHAGHTTRQETLRQRTDEEDDYYEKPAFTRDELEDMMKDPENLCKEISELITQSREFRTARDNYNEQLQEAKQTIARHETFIDQLMAQRSSSAVATPARAEAVPRTVSLPDPPLFDGSAKDGTTYENWIIQVKNKLRGNSDAYPTEDLRIIYAAGRLSGSALALISPRLDTASRHAYAAAEELFEHLDELYGDPNKEKNARQAFKELTMKKGQTFQEFYAAFLRCVADGNISPSDLKDDLNDKLAWKLQEAVATYYNDPAVTLAQFAKHCTTNDQQIRARCDRRERTTRKVDEARRVPDRQTPPPAGRTTDDKKPIARGLPVAELKCYNCYELGHIARDCSKPKTERTKQFLAAKLAALSPRREAEPENEKP